MIDLWIPNIRGQFFTWVYPVLRKDDSLTIYTLGYEQSFDIKMECPCGKSLFDSEVFVSPFNFDMVRCSDCTNSPLRNRRAFGRKFGKMSLLSIGASNDEESIYAEKILIGIVNTFIHRQGFTPNLPLRKLLQAYRKL